MADYKKMNDFIKLKKISCPLGCQKGGETVLTGRDLLLIVKSVRSDRHNDRVVKESCEMTRVILFYLLNCILFGLL